jgi:hypothetical protein
VQFIPGLLQIPEYARAVIALGHGDAPRAETDRRVELRMRRQQLLRRPHPPHLWALIDEAALRRPIGGAATMFAQLHHLIEVCDLPHVTIQVLSFRLGGHAAAGGPVTIVRLPGQALPDTVYLEQLATALYPDRPGDLDYYRHIMNRLATHAEPPDTTPAFLYQVLKEI